MDSTARTDPSDSDIINETAATGDAWIRQPKQPLVTQISSTKTAATGDAWIRQAKEALRTQIASTKLHPRVTLGFDIPNSA